MSITVTENYTNLSYDVPLITWNVSVSIRLSKFQITLTKAFEFSIDSLKVLN